MNIFSLLGEAGEVKSLIALWNKNKVDNTELIDRARALMGRLGFLEGEAGAPQGSNPFAKYDTRWFQAGLNIIDHAGLEEDGDLGPEGSKTRKAVMAYQTRKGRKPDGVPGPIMLGDLMQDLVDYESSQTKTKKK